MEVQDNAHFCDERKKILMITMVMATRLWATEEASTIVVIVIVVVVVVVVVVVAALMTIKKMIAEVEAVLHIL